LETNRETLERGNYNRATVTAEFRVPAFANRDYVELEVRWKYKYYTARLAEEENGDDTFQLRQDQKWTAGLSWHLNLIRQVALELGVEVERRTYNDPDKPYVASALIVGLSYRF